MNHIETRLRELKGLLPQGVSLVAVSKFQPNDAIEAAYEAGQRIFGESRVQEFLEKRSSLPQDIEWHFIGHLQTNKVKQIIGKTALIQSVDSERLLNIIEEESRKRETLTKVLLQVHVAQEETKFGFLPDEVMQFFAEKKFESLTNTHISGLMCMASNTDDTSRITEDFKKVSSLFDYIATSTPDLRGFETLSMGMSGDWPLAVEQGANLIRVGSFIFGERHY